MLELPEIERPSGASCYMEAGRLLPDIKQINIIFMMYQVAPAGEAMRIKHCTSLSLQQAGVSTLS